MALSLPGPWVPSLLGELRSTQGTWQGQKKKEYLELDGSRKCGFMYTFILTPRLWSMCIETFWYKSYILQLVKSVFCFPFCILDLCSQSSHLILIEIPIDHMVIQVTVLCKGHRSFWCFQTVTFSQHTHSITLFV